MNVKGIIKEHHQAMIDKGFYSCPKCEGKGGSIREEKDGILYGSKWKCAPCKGSGVDPDKNIGELLMLIVSELGEALEAHRNDRFADWKTIEKHNEVFNPECGISKNKSLQVLFEKRIKNTFEDEMADINLRIFDLCGYLKLNILPMSEFNLIKWKSPNIGQQLKQITKIVTNINEECIDDMDVSVLYEVVMVFCQKYSIDIEKHILAKMAYNKTRPHKHGKSY